MFSHLCLMLITTYEKLQDNQKVIRNVKEQYIWFCVSKNTLTKLVHHRYLRFLTDIKLDEISSCVFVLRKCILKRSSNYCVFREDVERDYSGIRKIILIV